jgi:endo-1,4-beta-mannosidase
MAGCELGFNQRGMIHWPDTQTWDTAFTQVKALNGSIVRAYVGYSDLTPDIAADRLHQFLARAAQHDVRVIAVLVDYYEPDWSQGHWFTPQGLDKYYKNRFQDLSLLDDHFFASGYRDEYLTFVKTVVQRNAGDTSLYAWEVGNELQNTAVVGFMKEVSDTIRGIDGTLKISSGVLMSSHALNRGEPQNADDLYGTLGNVDYATIHYYPENELADEPARQTEADQAKADGKAVILEELGVPAQMFVVQANTDRVTLMSNQLNMWAAKGAAAILLWGWPLVPGKEDQYIPWNAPDFAALVKVLKEFKG